MVYLSDITPGTKIIKFPENNIIAEVVDRPNRFIVRALIDGRELECHLHDPGRLRELIFPGNSILVRKAKGRRTEFSVTAALRDGEWILTDSRFHNKIAAIFLGTNAKPEVTVGKSRIDFLVEGWYVEVKGCSLAVEKRAKFPDAPSQRAVKHVHELARIVEEGGKAAIMVLVFSPESDSFEPNHDTDPKFYDAFYSAVDGGVEVEVLKFRTDPEGIAYVGKIPVLNRE